MVSNRCKMAVSFELEKLGVHCKSIQLGRVETQGFLSPDQIQEIKIALLNSGLELLVNKKNILIEKIKNVIVEMVHYSDNRLKTNFSNYLSSKLNLDYTYLANIFSEVQGTTIEHFVILHKIQRVKELIGNDELNLTEISWKMHYSSVAHLSAQFKKVAGFTPSHFKQLNHQRHTTLENV
jgi:AraC-like DNA-binding protein